MKKTFTMLLAGSAALALAACAEAEEPAAEEATEEMAEDAMAGETTAEASAEAADDNNDGLGGTSNPLGPLSEEAEAEE